MGNTKSNKWCCDSDIKQEIIVLNIDDSVASIVKIQSLYRGYLMRKKGGLGNDTSATLFKEVGLSYNTESLDSNPKILKLKALLPKFELTEKETYIIKTLSLKTIGLLYPDNSIYKGTVNEFNQREGFGKFYLPDGSIYEGFFKGNKMEGRGRLMNIKGFVYEGEFHNCIANGYGKYIGLDNVVYRGRWKDDKQNGIGDEYYYDGSHYRGDFINGKKNGRGKFSFPDGNSYDGYFNNNIISGEGVYRWKDGRSFFGNWDNNKMNGNGIFFWPDNKKYYGHYSHNNKEGFGIFEWADGKKYVGSWKEGKQHGYGYIESNNNKKTYGEWYQGKQTQTLNNQEEIAQVERAIAHMKEENEFNDFVEKIPQYEKRINEKN